ncbi:MAG TPA: tetratricopeptide repeat protein [Bryobacteraceae bacterium]|nr:tetratricopeptide repeat protein [Bryobacteraceae bacterium]
MPGIRFFPALSIFLVAVITALGSAESLRDEGIAAFNRGQYSVALDKLQRAVSADSQDAKARVFLALTQAARNDCPPALPVLKADSKNPDNQLARLAGLATVKCDEAGGRELDAMMILDRLQQRFPADADVLYAVAKLHMKAFNEATRRMYQRTPSSYRVHELSAEIFEIQNRFDEAVDEYQKAIALNPNAPDLHFRLGRALLLRSHSGAALEQASQAFLAELKLNPEDAASEFQLGQIAGAQNKPDAARAHFEKALVLSPSFPEAMVALGKLDAQAKQYDRAISLLKRAIGLQPANETAHYALMMAYRDSGQMEKAKAEKAELDRLQRPPEGEFTQFLKKLGEKPPQ